MLQVDLLDAHVRGLSANDVDIARPLARRYGFRPTIADTLRFSVELAAVLSRLVDSNGSIAGLPEGFSWPKRVRRKPDWFDRLDRKRAEQTRRAAAVPEDPAASTEVE